MSWGRLDDSIIDHPKFAAVATNDDLKPVERLAAVGLWAKGNAYCAKHLTDGFIPRGVVPLLAGASMAIALKLAQALVDARGRSACGLWEIAEGGYQVHDWHDWNRSKESVEAQRAIKAAAGRAGGVRSGQARRQANTKHRAQAYASAESKHVLDVLPNSHPIPVVTPQPPEASASQGSKRYGRQPDGQYRLHDGMFNTCPAGRLGQCVRTEHLDDVPDPRQCDEHRAQA